MLASKLLGTLFLLPLDVMSMKFTEQGTQTLNADYADFLHFSTESEWFGFQTGDLLNVHCQNHGCFTTATDQLFLIIFLSTKREIYFTCLRSTLLMIIIGDRFW